MSKQEAARAAVSAEARRRRLSILKQASRAKEEQRKRAALAAFKQGRKEA